MGEKASGRNGTGETDRSKGMTWDLHSECNSFPCDNCKQERHAINLISFNISTLINATMGLLTFKIDHFSASGRHKDWNSGLRESID